MDEAQQLAALAQAIEDRRVACLLAGDFDAVAGMLGEGLIYGHSTGLVDDKASLLASYRSGKVQYRAVRRQNIWHNSRRKLAECGPRPGVDIKRRSCGGASGDVRWSSV